MNGGILPLVLLCAASGLAFAFAARRAAWISLCALGAAALLTSLVSVPDNARHAIFVGLWISTAATAALTYLRRGLTDNMAIAVGINNGVWAGAIASLAGMQRSLLIALPLILCLIPGRWLATRGYAIILKVVASWIIAVSVLAGMVSFAPTPGYAPDHME